MTSTFWLVANLAGCRVAASRRSYRSIDTTANIAERPRVWKCDTKKYVAEAIGTFWLTLGGCGSAVTRPPPFRRLASDFSGWPLPSVSRFSPWPTPSVHVSGCHLNPAVTVGLTAGRRFPASQIGPYVVAQIVGAFVRDGALPHRQRRAGFDAAQGFAANGYGAHSPGHYGLLLMFRDRSDHDDDVLVHHHGLHAWQGAGRFSHPLR